MADKGRVSPATSTIILSTVILVVPTILLLLVVASQLHGYTQPGVGGWNLSFNILTARASPFGTPAGVWAVILAVWGFLLVPAVAGAAAALILGAYLTRSQRSIDHAIDMANSRSAKRREEAKKRIEAAEAKKLEADQEEAKANEAEAEAAAAAKAKKGNTATGNAPPPAQAPVQDRMSP